MWSRPYSNTVTDYYCSRELTGSGGKNTHLKGLFKLSILTGTSVFVIHRFQKTSQWNWWITNTGVPVVIFTIYIWTHASVFSVLSFYSLRYKYYFNENMYIFNPSCCLQLGLHIGLSDIKFRTLDKPAIKM